MSMSEEIIDAVLEPDGTLRLSRQPHVAPGPVRVTISSRTTGRSPHIEDDRESKVSKTPGIVGGEARIRQTRIPIWSLIQLRNHGVSDTEIKGYFETRLSDEDLVAAWDYYKWNKEEIDNAVKRNEAE